MRHYQKTLLFFSLLLLTGTLGGGMPVFIKLGVISVPPLYFSVLRFAISSLALIALYPFFSAGKKDWKYSGALIVSSIGNIGNVALFSIGIPYTSAAFSQILYLLCPIFIYLISIFFFGTRAHKTALLGALLGLAGGGLTVLSRLELRAELPGIILLFGAIISYTWFAISSKPLQQHFSPFHQTLAMSILQVVAMLFLSSVFETPASIPLTTPVISSLLYVGVLGSALYYLLLQYLIKLSTPFAATTILYIQPIAALVWEQILFREQITPLFVIGGTLCICGAWLIARHSGE